MSPHSSSASEAPSAPMPDDRSARPGNLTRVQILFLLTMGLADAGFLCLGHYLAYLATRLGPEVILGSFTEWLVLPAVHLPMLVGAFMAQRMYQRRRLVGNLDEAIKILLVNGVLVLILLAILTLLIPDINVYRRQIVFAWAFTSFLITLGRILHTRIRWAIQSRGWGVDQVLVVGSGETARIILQRVMATPKLGHVVVGTVSDHAEEDHFQEVPWLGRLSDIPALIRIHGIDEVIVGMPEASPAELVRIVDYCERERVGIRLLPNLFQIMAQEVTIGDLSGLPLLTVRDSAMQGWKLVTKRAIDVVFSLVALILLSPWFLLNALLIKMESPGPVFYIQVRMGLDAIPFHMLKFRSMQTNAEAKGPGWTTPNDTRRTRLGRFLRSKSLDELPNFINVLMNDMSIVGPRPERPVFVEEFRRVVPNYMERHKEKGGITGWAQINGLRGDCSIEERIKYDLWYIENWSIALDLKIMAITAWKILFRTDPAAY